MARASDYDPRVLALFDGYVHGRLTRRQFLDQATRLVAAGSTAVLASLAPDYARANQVDPADPAIHAEYKKYPSPGHPDCTGKVGVEFEEFTYPDANHGFHNDTTPRFDEDAAQLAWQRTVEFFDRYLK
jgi:dienelactone hydrolase